MTQLSPEEWAARFPLHVKAKELEDKTQFLGEFLEWLCADGTILARWGHNQYNPEPHNESILSLIGRFTGIDPQAFDAEKVDMLSLIRDEAPPAQKETDVSDTPKWNPGLIEFCAVVAHEMHVAYCRSLGDTSQVRWSKTSDENKALTMRGVEARFGGATPEQLHEIWVRQKKEAGWVFGPRKDADAKTHPSLVRYDDLPETEQLKDTLFAVAIGAGAELYKRYGKLVHPGPENFGCSEPADVEAHRLSVRIFDHESCVHTAPLEVDPGALLPALQNPQLVAALSAALAEAVRSLLTA